MSLVDLRMKGCAGIDDHFDGNWRSSGQETFFPFLEQRQYLCLGLWEGEAGLGRGRRTVSAVFLLVLPEAIALGARVGELDLGRRRSGNTGSVLKPKLHTC